MASDRRVRHARDLAVGDDHIRLDRPRQPSQLGAEDNADARRGSVAVADGNDGCV
ncbi:MAG: hypothetical protein AVDCRST_MAG77-206 [uncultured Chloroflexi bacterium]|uniref:Uncharacterized protein n=1 Tax=uncultured Chloroflexota bacterium TaxID=166587 RepID=A0A6J4H9P9_9CHLR|nr:MAG: hypothetical protein AVDCRST_MAG77-206 [uncultured Chloroflexota bacterium]